MATRGESRVAPRAVLVLADRVPRPGLRVGEHRLLQLLFELTSLEPRPHVTLLVGEWCARADPADVVALFGVEVVSYAPDCGEWFATRRFELVIVHGEVCARRFRPFLDGAAVDCPRLVDTSALASFAHPAPLAPLVGDARGRDLLISSATALDTALVDEADTVLCASEHESRLTRRFAPEATTVVLRCASSASAPAPFPPRSMRRDVAIIGSFLDDPGAPDEDAALFIAEEVMPRVRAATGAVLHVIAEDLTPALLGRFEGVRLHHARGSMDSWIGSVRAVFAIRRYGRGLVASLIAASARSVPVIMNAHVAGWNDAPEGLHSGSTPDEIGDAAITLLMDDRAWDRSSRAAGEWAAGPLHPDHYREVLDQLLRELGWQPAHAAEQRFVVPWEARARQRWAPVPADRAASAGPGLELALADEVVTGGLDEPAPAVHWPAPPSYDQWLRERDLSPRRRWARRSELAALPWRPLVSVLCVVRDDPTAHIGALIRSVAAQEYTNWELCLIDDASRSPEVLGMLRVAAERDARVRIGRFDERRGDAAGLGEALARARGAFITPLELAGSLEPFALGEAVELINRSPEVDIVYTDEHVYDAGEDRFCSPTLKPSWAPDLLRSCNYFGHLTVLRRSLAEQVGGFRAGTDGAHTYDLLLRATEVSDRVGHVAKPLFRSHPSPSRAEEPLRVDQDAAATGRRVLAESVERATTGGIVDDLDRAGRYRVRYPILGRPSVGVVIPTRDRVDLLANAISSIRNRSTYDNVDIVIVDNGSSDPAALEYLREHDGPVLRYPWPFNFARMMNLALVNVPADLLLFVNNDVEVHQPDWIEAMLEHAQRPPVGAVGARLWYPTGTPQHQGIFIGGAGAAHNADFARSPTNRGEWHFISTLGSMVSNFSAVTGACLMARPSVLAEVGGFEERLHVAFNDVDLCLKLRSRGYEVVCTPFASLVHYESATRGSNHPMENDHWFRTRWHITDDFQDPYSNPNYDQRRRFLLRPSLSRPLEPA